MIICSVVVIATLLLLYTQPFKHLGTEDGFMENLGALSFLLTSVVFFGIFLQLRKAKETTPKDLGAWYWYLTLAILFFFVAGEEISWGQRLFNWGTPDWMESNVQKETTIHNLEIFNAHTKDHEAQAVLAIVANHEPNVFTILAVLVSRSTFSRKIHCTHKENNRVVSCSRAQCALWLPIFHHLCIRQIICDRYESRRARASTVR